MITQHQVDKIAQQVSNNPLSDNVIEQLRCNFPELHFTYCQDDDVIGTRPAYVNKTFNLYLIDKANHCICFTQDMQVATGVVLAEIEQDTEE